METRMVPERAFGFTHSVPGVQAFASIDITDAEGSKVTLTFHQPAALTEFSDMCSELAASLLLVLAAPAPEEGDAP